MVSSLWRGFPAAARRFLWGGLFLELGHAFLWALQNLYVRSLGFGEEEVGRVLMAAGVGVAIATVLAAGLAVVGLLMVSPFPYRSFKDVNVRGSWHPANCW